MPLSNQSAIFLCCHWTFRKLASATNTCKYISYMLLHTVSASSCNFSVSFHLFPCLWDSILRHMNRTNKETHLTVPPDMAHTSLGWKSHKFLIAKYNLLVNFPICGDINLRGLFGTSPWPQNPELHHQLPIASFSRERRDRAIHSAAQLLSR